MRNVSRRDRLGSPLNYSLGEPRRESIVAGEQKPKMENPLKFLRVARNNTVLVKLKDGSESIGKLIFSDNTMNLILDDCEERDPQSGETIAKYGRVMIRGSYVMYISLDYHKVLGL